MGLFDKIKNGLKKTRDLFTGRMDELVENYKELDDDFYEDLTDILIMADLGVKTTEMAVNRLRERCRAEKIGDPAKAREALKDILVDILSAEPMKLESPMVLLIIGVNGVGKTTSIGKLASRMKTMGRRVIICAADTFRAAAADQLEIWADRADCEIVRSVEGADPGAVLFDSLAAAKARNVDVVLCDTAGRLHNKVNLMNELSKLRKIIDRETPDAAKETLLVLDATTGQNGLQQAKVFRETAGLTGIILTKLDGTAKGGICVAIAQELGVPVKFVGLGEGIDDLQPFNAEEYVKALI